MEVCFLFQLNILSLSSGCVLSHGVFSLEVFCKFPENKLILCSDTDNYASEGVHFSYYHYHMQLLKSFKSKLKSPYKRGYSSGWHPMLSEEISSLHSCVAVDIYMEFCTCNPVSNPHENKTIDLRSIKLDLEDCNLLSL